MNISMFANFSYLLETRGADEAVRVAAELGFDSVEHLEIVGRPRILKDSGDVETLSGALAAHGLTLSCYSVAVNLWEKGMTPDTVTEAERELLRNVDNAAELGCRFLHHTLLLGVDGDELSLDGALELIVPVAVRVARYAHGRGVTCLYEDQGMHFNGVEGFGAFYGAVKEQCPYVGVCGDMGNMLFVDESPTEFFKTYASEMKHVHIKDYHTADACGGDGWSQSRGGRWLKDAVIGEGDVDIVACLGELKRVGYGGIFSLENCHGGDFAHGVACGMSLLRENWE